MLLGEQISQLPDTPEGREIAAHFAKIKKSEREPQINVAELIAKGRELGDKPEPPKSNAIRLMEEIIAAGREAGQKANGGYPVHQKSHVKDWTDERKMKACPRNGGTAYGILIMLSDVERYGMHCNLCPGCFKHNAEQLKERMAYTNEKAKYELGKDGKMGHWRRAVVEDDKEAKALKKKIKRTQESRHVEFAAEAPGHNEVWVYVDNETKNPERFGEEVDIEDIDFDKVYAANRETGKKFSVGKGLKKSAATSDNQEVVRVILPEIIVAGGEEAANKAEKIARETHYCQEAETTEEAIELFAYQTKFIIAEIEKEGIAVIGINYRFRNYSPKYVLEQWNRTVRYWMSINAPLGNKDYGANMDIANRLHYPVNKKEALDEPLN